MYDSSIGIHFQRIGYEIKEELDGQNGLPPVLPLFSGGGVCLDNSGSKLLQFLGFGLHLKVRNATTG